MKRVAMSPLILLCGGKSSRMGHPKGLVPYRGRPWIEQQLIRAEKVGIRDVVIVLGYVAEEYLCALPWLADALLGNGTEAFGLNIRALINPQPQFGPFSSIQVGAANAQPLSHAVSGYFWILPIDVPCPKRQVWERLADSNAQACVPTFEGRGGHPVKLSDSFLHRIRQCPSNGEDARLDRQIQLLGSEAERLEVDDPDIIRNINTPSEMKELEKNPEAPGPC